nr:hypothetical protein [uncultured Carboxylicivirga sp.]
MHHFVWQIDFERQQIIVAKRPDDLEFGSNYFEIPLNENKKSHHLRTKVRFGENRPLKSVLVDLGSNSTLFLSERDVLNDSIKYLSKGILGQASKGLGEEDSVITYRYYKTDSLFFNNSDFAVSDVTVCTASKSLNLLGLGFFENYKTTINWPDKKLILEPVHPNSGFIGKTKGFSLIYNKDKSVAEIGALVENTAASKANFKLKTQVIAINEISLLNYESYCRYRNTDLSNDTIEVTFKGEDGSKRIVRLLEEPIFD